jgi:hypothetical protein
MGSTLYTLYICLITPILGTGLALRGNEGSVDRAVVSLARVSTKVIRSFAYALRLLQFSVLMKAFLTFHLYAAVVCACFVVYYFVSIQMAERRILSTFHIAPSKIVTGRFEVREASSRLKGLGRSASRPLSPTPLAAMPTVVPKAASRSRFSGFNLRSRRAASDGDTLTTRTFNAAKFDPYAMSSREARDSNAPQMPTAVSRDLMFRNQGPLPPAVRPAVVL